MLASWLFLFWSAANALGGYDFYAQDLIYDSRSESSIEFDRAMLATDSLSLLVDSSGIYEHVAYCGATSSSIYIFTTRWSKRAARYWETSYELILSYVSRVYSWATVTQISSTIPFIQSSVIAISLVPSTDYMISSSPNSPKFYAKKSFYLSDIISPSFWSITCRFSRRMWSLQSVFDSGRLYKSSSTIE
jgi:hypothetical protein